MISQKDTPSAKRDQSQLFYSQDREHKDASDIIQNQTTEPDFMQFNHNLKKLYDNLMNI